MELFFSSDAGGILLLSLLAVFQVIEFSRNVAKYVVVIITVDVGRIEGFCTSLKSLSFMEQNFIF